MLTIDYVCVSVGPIILHASSTQMFSIQIAKHAFKKEVFTCFGFVPEIKGSLQKGEKCPKRF